MRQENQGLSNLNDIGDRVVEGERSSTDGYGHICDNGKNKCGEGNDRKILDGQQKQW